jgi:hypothetical protein
LPRAAEDLSNAFREAAADDPKAFLQFSERDDRTRKSYRGDTHADKDFRQMNQRFAFGNLMISK